MYNVLFFHQSNKPPISTSSSGSGAFSTGFSSTFLAAYAYAATGADAYDAKILRSLYFTSSS